MSSATSETIGNLFQSAGMPLLFDLGLIQHEELLRELKRTIWDFGGKIVTPQDPDSGTRYVLYDQNNHESSLLIGLARRPDRICLKWDWVLDCHEQQRIITENDYSGNHFIPPRAPADVSPLTTTAVLGTDYSNPASQNSESTFSAQRLRSPSLPRTSVFSAASTSYDAQHTASPSGTGVTAALKRTPRRPGKRKRVESTPTKSKRARLPSGKGPKVHNQTKEEEDVDGVALGEPELAENYLPAPPTKIVKNDWFGYDYTEDDYEYMKQCITIICEKQYDPDFKKLWKDMAKAAKHHNAPGWKHFFEKNETRLASEIPSLRRLYQHSSDEDTHSLNPSKRQAWQPKEVYKDRSVEEKVSEDDRRNLIKFMADAPDGGVTQEELLQNFCRLNTHHSWRTWQRLIHDNKTSFDRAVARRREVNRAGDSRT